MPPHSPCAWMNAYCPLLDGQFVFLDPLSWQTHQLNESAVLVLQAAAEAIESGDFADFLHEIEQAGGWPPGLEFLVRSLATLDDITAPDLSQ